jgi:hypothetical protein
MKKTLFKVQVKSKFQMTYGARALARRYQINFKRNMFFSFELNIDFMRKHLQKMIQPLSNILNKK